MADIRLGRAADFSEVMDRVVTSFRAANPVHPRFEYLYPDSVRAETMRQWRLALAEGEVAAGIQLVPRALVSAGVVRLSGVGLGNVFCCPRFRKRGLMSALLERCIADMQEAGDAVCLLGGDRTRYGNFGWEHAGADRALTLSARVTRFETGVQAVSAADLRVWEGDRGDALRMLEAYAALRSRTERSATEFARVLMRPGQTVWICDEPEKGFAYVSVRGGTILEYAGSGEALEAILRYLLCTGSWTVSVPPTEGSGELEARLLAHAQHYSVKPTGMVRIISMERVFQAYMPVLRERLQGWEGELAFRATDDGETVAIVGERGSLTVESRPAESVALALGRRDLARLFFGPFPPDLGDWHRHSAIRCLFPLPLHWHALAHV